MNETLKRFTRESLFDATSALLSKLNIFFDRETAQPIDVTELYEPPMPKYFTDALQHIQNTYFIGIVNDLSLQGNKSADRLEDALDRMKERGDKYDGMFVFACDAKPDTDLKRSDAAALTRGFNRLARANPVILVIRQNNLLSLATSKRMDYTQQWRQESGERVGQVNILRNINCDAPHRGHINILNSLGEKQFTTFEGLYNHWFTTFSNELLTKKFYTELSDWFAWAVKVCRFPNDLSTRDDDDKFNHEACIRLITRLIFVWFLKEKKLIPEEFFNQDYIRENLISEFAPTGRKTAQYDPKQSKYYRLILQNLFFAMLNRPIVAEGKTTPNNRRFMRESYQGKNPDYNINNIMRYKKDFTEGGAEKFIKLANNNVPFLNGGLFECLDNKSRKMYYDGFSEKDESLEQLYLPDFLFFGSEDGHRVDLSKWYGDKNKKNATVRGLIDILKRYSFTIEENTPLDQEVSLDPELLGKVFENLLAAYNPETQKSARKQTGSFYTPREIVQYMVDESLVAHLKRMCGDELEPKYRDLLSYGSDEVKLTEEQRWSIMSAIYNCRVLDPACGSGAFPMGILQQMVHVIKRIDPSNEMWNKMIMDIALEETRKELEKVAKGTEEERHKAEENRKARLEDIEGAFNRRINYPDYARKLYLIEHCIYGVDIQPIAIQISKLRFFISLVVNQKTTKDPKTNFGIRPLPNLESKFVTANTLIPLDRSRSLFTSTDDTRFYEEMLHDLNHRIFLAKRNADKQELQKQMIDVRRMMAQTLENLHVIGGDGYTQLTEWDMFDQNASAPFFDPEWMFGIKDGFDVVIGNPPYFQVKKGLVPKNKYPYSEGKDVGKQNMYKLFIEASYNFLCENGISALIVQSSLMCDLSSSFTRELLLKHTCIDKIIEFPKTAPTPEGQLFESVCQGTCICLFMKQDPDDHKFMLSVNNDCTTLSNMEKEYVAQVDLIDFYPQDFAIPLLHPKEFPILKKIKNNAKLKDFIYSAIQGDLNLTSEKKHFGNAVTPIVLLRGRHVAKFSINYDADEFVEIGYKSNIVAENSKNRYIVCQQITGLVDYRRIHCALTNPSETFLFGNSVNKMLVRNPQKGPFILALLNSKLMDWVFRKTSSNNHVNCYELVQLPIKDTEEIQPFNSLVEILSNYPHGEALYSKETILIDILVYHLYGLTYDEIMIIDPETPITHEEYDNYKAD